VYGVQRSPDPLWRVLLSWIEGHPGTAAWVQAVGAIIALVIAIAVPWFQQWWTKLAEQRSLRHALHTEVAMVAEQCILELRHWRVAQPPPTPINPRTALLPPLVIFSGNSGKVGLLSREEILHLIGFSGTLHDLSIVVNDMIERDVHGKEYRERVQVLLSNACGSAAKFLAAVPGIADAADDQPFIEALRKAYGAMNDVRTRARDQSDPAGRADF
jgi:hypothetical protein